jgi:hypothetical protein
MDHPPQLPLQVGWKEIVDFPDWRLRNVRVKIDTGARTSALDVSSYELHQESDGMVAELRLALYRKHPERVKVVRAPVLRMVVVSNSNGMKEQRPLIETQLRLGDFTKIVQLTITNRCSMCFPVILGRKFLEGHFIVDVSRKFVQRK